MTASDVKKEINTLGSKQRAEHSLRFFKTGKGEYGEGDKFLGLSMPEQRIIAKKYRYLSLSEIQKLVRSPFHEHRMVGLIIVTLQYHEASEKIKKQLYIFYLKNTKYINNWDLVDVTTPRIVGEYLVNRNKEILNTLAVSKSLWERRIAVLATFAFIRRGDLTHTFALAKKLLSDREDLMHKAVGWMLREAGKQNQDKLEHFLRIYAQRMPRTMLRYAIEKFPPKKRQIYLGLGK